MSPELEVDRGARARRILEDDLWKDAVEKVATSIRRAWENSRPDDTEARERAYLELRLLNALVGDLKKVLETGELAGRQIERARGK